MDEHIVVSCRNWHYKFNSVLNRICKLVVGRDTYAVGIVRLDIYSIVPLWDYDIAALIQQTIPELFCMSVFNVVYCICVTRNAITTMYTQPAV